MESVADHKDTEHKDKKKEEKSGEGEWNPQSMASAFAAIDDPQKPAATDEQQQELKRKTSDAGAHEAPPKPKPEPTSSSSDKALQSLEVGQRVEIVGLSGVTGATYNNTLGTLRALV